MQSLTLKTSTATLGLSLLLALPAVARAADTPPAEPPKENPVLEKVRGTSVDLDSEYAAAAALPRTVYRLGHGGAAPAALEWDDMLAELATARVVFLGEQHDDDATHRLQYQVLAELSQWRDTALAMEQFERDVQPQVDAWLAAAQGEQAELDFLTASRPWGNYAADYRRLLWLARERCLPVIASNTPTPVVRKVSREGWEAAWGAYTAQEKSWLAESSTHPEDHYWQNFKLAMGLTPEVEAELARDGGAAQADTGHGMGMDLDTAWRFYQAQCLKDDTMAESVVRWLDCNPCGLVIHTNGRFHSDYKLGAAQRTIDRLRAGGDCDECSVRVVSFVPVPDLASTSDLKSAAWDGLEGVADYVVFVTAPPAP